MDVQSHITKTLVGLACTRVTKVENSWHLSFGDRKACLRLDCPWRVLVDNAIRFADEDHGQQFGLPAPVDGEQRTCTLLQASPVIAATLRIGPGDIAIDFENGSHLEVFTNSAGYESWAFRDDNGFELIAMGGGKLGVWEMDPGGSRAVLKYSI